MKINPAYSRSPAPSQKGIIEILTVEPSSVDPRRVQPRRVKPRGVQPSKTRPYSLLLLRIMKKRKLPKVSRYLKMLYSGMKLSGNSVLKILIFTITLISPFIGP
jgi:hypothetical protein